MFFPYERQKQNRKSFLKKKKIGQDIFIVLNQNGRLKQTLKQLRDSSMTRNT